MNTQSYFPQQMPRLHPGYTQPNGSYVAQRFNVDPTQPQPPLAAPPAFQHLSYPQPAQNQGQPIADGDYTQPILQNPSEMDMDNDEPQYSVHNQHILPQAVYPGQLHQPRAMSQYGNNGCICADCMDARVNEYGWVTGGAWAGQGPQEILQRAASDQQWSPNALLDAYDSRLPNALPVEAQPTPLTYHAWASSQLQPRQPPVAQSMEVQYGPESAPLYPGMQNPTYYPNGDLVPVTNPLPTLLYVSQMPHFPPPMLPAGTQLQQIDDPDEEEEEEEAAVHPPIPLHAPRPYRPVGPLMGNDIHAGNYPTENVLPAANPYPTHVVHARAPHGATQAHDATEDDIAEAHDNHVERPAGLPPTPPLSASPSVSSVVSQTPESAQSPSHTDSRGRMRRDTSSDGISAGVRRSSRRRFPVYRLSAADFEPEKYGSKATNKSPE